MMSNWTKVTLVCGLLINASDVGARRPQGGSYLPAAIRERNTSCD